MNWWRGEDGQGRSSQSWSSQGREGDGGSRASSILTTGLKEALLARTPFWQRYIIMFTSGPRAPAHKAKGLTHMDTSSFRQHCFLPSFLTAGRLDWLWRSMCHRSSRWTRLGLRVWSLRPGKTKLGKIQGQVLFFRVAGVQEFLGSSQRSVEKFVMEPEGLKEVSVK